MFSSIEKDIRNKVILIYGDNWIYGGFLNSSDKTPKLQFVKSPIFNCPFNSVGHP